MTEEDTQMYDCPAEGCDYGPLPLNSVTAHYSGSTTGDHQGGYERAKTRIKHGSDTDSPDENESTESQTEASENNTETKTEPQSETQSVDSGLGLSGGRPFETTDTTGSETVEIDGEETGETETVETDENGSQETADESSGSGGLVAIVLAVGGLVGLTALMNQENNSDDPYNGKDVL